MHRARRSLLAPSSSGGSTVGEALNILERFDLRAMGDAEALHHYLEASALAFADRGAYVGDPVKVDVPLAQLLDDEFAQERACAIGQTSLAKPTAPGDVDDYDGVCPNDVSTGAADADTENISTTNLTVADRWGNVVEAIAAPRASQRNTAKVTAEPAFIAAYGALLEEVYGHDLVPSGDGLTSASDIGAATAIRFGPQGRMTAVAEPDRRGGGAAYVVRRVR